MFHFGTDKKDWVQIEQCSIASVLGAQIFFDQYSNFSWHLNGLRFRNLILLFKNHMLQTYVPQSDMNFITQSLKNRFINLNKELTDGIRSITSTNYKNLNVFSRQIRRTKLSLLEDEHLANLFLDYYQVILNEIFLVNFKPLEIAAMKVLRDIVRDKNTDSAQSQRDITALSTMDKPSLSSKEEIDLCTIVTMTLEPAKIRRALSRTRNRSRLLERNYPDLYELFEEHYNKYRYLIGGYSELHWTIDDFIRRYHDLLELGPEWAEERIEQLSAHTRSNSLSKRRTLARLKDNGTMRKLSKIISDLAMLDENNRITYAQALGVRELLLEEIIERNNVNKDDLRFYNLDDILTLIRDRERLDGNEITRRYRGVVFNSGVYLLSGSDATRFLDKKIPVKPRKHILTGVCAYPGLFQGPVKLIRSLDDAQKVEYGDVVITPSSGTEFAEAIRKAGAVVIASGAILSPTVQMCRETKTPCLINVQDAFETLKNGDQIILDAEGQNVCFAKEPDKHVSSVDICEIKVFDFDEKEASAARLEEIEPDAAHIFGTKGTTLGLLLREGFLIPPGFILGRAAMYQYLAQKGCEISNGVYEQETVERARKMLLDDMETDYLRSLPLDATVIFDEDGCTVRGSWLPGNISSGVKVPSTTTLAVRTLEALWKAIRKCWRAFLEQPLTLKQAGEETQAVGGGVIIQQYKPGDRSGIISSLDLDHPGSNVITLEACLGTGHSLHTGKTRSDRYRISRKTERIINRIIPLKTRFEMVQPKTGKLILIPVPEDIIEAEVLSRQQIKILVHAALKIEKLMEMPVSIEWTIKSGEIYVINAEIISRN